jgi:hypothetical protein
MSILKWIAARLKERTTWLGLASLLSAVGVAIAPELQEAIISAGVAVGGLILVVTKENPKE